MRAMRAAMLAVGLIALFTTTASATSVLSLTREGGAPYYSGPSSLASTALTIGGARCEVARLTGRVTAGSSSVNSTINPFITSGFERCGGLLIFGNNVNNWVATFNVSGLTVTISNWEIVEEETFARCVYRGTLNGTYTNPLPPARAKIAVESTVPRLSGGVLCASSRLVRGTFDFAATEPVTQDLWLVSR